MYYCHFSLSKCLRRFKRAYIFQLIYFILEMLPNIFFRLVLKLIEKTDFIQHFFVQTAVFL